MIEKIKALFKRKKKPSENIQYTREVVSKLVNDAYSLGYNDGRRDGLAIAREQASKSLKEILWQQNQKK